ncbi:hypothetical protein OC846_000173 [Tilletia horrida]|uniref:Uncharacterized protein n=1 Tax=Tilletia horrida TaxID=155126 RepID=A0AAN6GVN5_9BASI|nr:hypothetical protein OC845_000459 [Tilletia horrida]KAK0557878.1 hypothetical protein OC846_000173 [Tilletia horrida]
MGSAASKPGARKLAQTATTQVRSGAPVSQAGAAAEAAAPSRSAAAARESNAVAFQASQDTRGPRVHGYDKHSASERKTKEILEDAGDPTFLRNLQTLGPVAVEHPESPLSGRDTYQSRMHEILAARARDADESIDADALYQQPSSAGSFRAAAPLRLSPNTLANLLDDLKDCRSQEEVFTVATEYDVPIETIVTLTKYINTPSVSESKGKAEREARLRLEGDDDGPPLVYAVWTDPKVSLSTAPKQIESS